MPGMWVGVHVGMGPGPSLHTPHMTHTRRCPTLTRQSGYAKIGSAQHAALHWLWKNYTVHIS